MKQKKRPKASKNHADRMINDLLFELSKFTHYSKKEIERYYFIKRLQSYIPIYEGYIKKVSTNVLRAASSFNNFKRLNKKKK